VVHPCLFFTACLLSFGFWDFGCRALRF
jgi:hypothetical protein